MLLYLLQVNIVWAICFVGLRLMFIGDTFFTLRRMLLLLLSVFALIFPFLVSVWPDDVAAGFVPATANAWYESITVNAQSSNLASVGKWLPVAYVMVVAVILVARSVQFCRIVICIRRLPQKQWGGLPYRELPSGCQPFSFLGWMCLPPETFASPMARSIVAHEYAHVFERHTLDVLWMHVCCAVCWPNPFVWFTKRELTRLHEFLADRKAVGCAPSVRDYQCALVAAHAPGWFMSDTSALGSAPLKVRISMMGRRPVSWAWCMKYLVMLPLVIVLLSYGSALRTAAWQAGDYISSPPVRQDVAESEHLGLRRTAALDDGATHADELPQFPGGNAMLFKMLLENLRYPDDAMEQGISGRVLVAYTVTADGRACGIRIMRGLYPSIDREALRVANLLKYFKFSPGRISGHAVDVNMVLPISFSLK